MVKQMSIRRNSTASLYRIIRSARFGLATPGVGTACGAASDEQLRGKIDQCIDELNRRFAASLAPAVRDTAGRVDLVLEMVCGIAEADIGKLMDATREHDDAGAFARDELDLFAHFQQRLAQLQAARYRLED
jgi:hypothetical protein